MSWEELFVEEKKDIVKELEKKAKRAIKKETERKLTKPRKSHRIIKKNEIPEISVDEIRVKVMEHLVRHQKKYRHLLGHLPKSWGGRLSTGGGWSAGWLQLLDIVAEVLPDLITQKLLLSIEKKD